MVPEGWRELQVGAVCSEIIDCVNKTATVVAETTPFKMIRTTNVRNGRVDTENVRYVTEDTFRIWTRRGTLRTGDIILTREAPVGEVGQLVNADGMFLGQRTMLYRADPKKMVQSFLFQTMISPMLKEQYVAASAGGTVHHIRVPDCSKFIVRVPPLPEQQKIAEILSIWDKATETTEALLANARTQKRALMQSLLTGTRRFPGFEGQPWREVRLQQIADIIVSNVDKKSEPHELPVRLCNYTDVYKNDTIRSDMDFMEATATPAQIKKFGLKVGDVIITKDSEDPTDIAVPTYVAETADDLVCGYHLAIIRANDRADGRFLKYCFELPHTRYYFGARANGATRFGLNISSIETAVFHVPSVAEQRAVADAILLVEQEISHTIRELDHFRSEKQSLMQQLLTGKRRAII